MKIYFFMSHFRPIPGVSVPSHPDEKSLAPFFGRPVTEKMILLPRYTVFVEKNLYY